MRKIILGALALVLGVTVFGTSAVQAGPGHRPYPGPTRSYYPGQHYGHNHGPYPTSSRAYYQDYGVRFNGGYYYRGHQHNHWGWKVYNTQYQRTHYWDPYLRCYFYYCPERCNYYPVGCTLP